MIFLNFSCLPYSPVITRDCSLQQIHDTVERITRLKRIHYYLLHGGLPLYDEDLESSKVSGEICVVPRLLGGKGGFGSMLRAIGAQIEKTTNREACRDLSGRRLRDINEEQRLKTWISQQSEREKEADERKRRKLEKLSAEPRHEFTDDKYDQARTELTEKLFECVQQGIQASTSVKRPSETDEVPKKKVKKFLRCEEEDLLSSSDESVDVNAVESRGSSDCSDVLPTESSLALIDTAKSDSIVPSGL